MTGFSIDKINEVYNKVYSDDRGAMQELSEYFTFKVPGAEFMPSYRNRMWDGKEIVCGMARYVCSIPTQVICMQV